MKMYTRWPKASIKVPWIASYLLAGKQSIMATDNTNIVAFFSKRERYIHNERQSSNTAAVALIQLKDVLCRCSVLLWVL